MFNALTIDVEDYYHVEAFQAVIQRKDWDSYEPRIYNNTLKILEVLARHGIEATFFILGWVAEHTPVLSRKSRPPDTISPATVTRIKSSISRLQTNLPMTYSARWRFLRILPVRKYWDIALLVFR